VAPLGVAGPAGRTHRRGRGPHLQRGRRHPLRRREVPHRELPTRAGVFDRSDPASPIARAETPFLLSDDPEVLEGQVDNVCFAQGLVLFHDSWFLYYGMADSRIGCATAPHLSSTTRVVNSHGSGASGSPVSGSRRRIPSILRNARPTDPGAWCSLPSEPWPKRPDVVPSPLVPVRPGSGRVFGSSYFGTFGRGCLRLRGLSFAEPMR
jgi:hypothetical protein